MVTAILGAVAGGNLVLILLDMLRAGSEGDRSPATQRRTRSRRISIRTHRPVPGCTKGADILDPVRTKINKPASLHGRGWLVPS